METVDMPKKKWARLKVTSRYLIFVLMEGNKVS